VPQTIRWHAFPADRPPRHLGEDGRLMIRAESIDGTERRTFDGVFYDPEGERFYASGEVESAEVWHVTGWAAID
jgi:hypothetical protein